MTEDGFRVDVVVRDPNCPIQETAARAGTETDTINRSTVPAGDTVVEEFRFIEDAADELACAERFKSMTFAGSRRYRFERPVDQVCLCVAVETSGHPVTNLRATEDCLYASFYAAESEDLSELIRSLTDSFDLSVRRIVHSDVEHPDDLVILDRGALTDRQLEALRTAHEAGYFDVPKGANAGDVADELGVSRSTFLAHLNKAQSKLLDGALDGTTPAKGRP